MDLRRVLVVRPDNIGDLVMLTPALRALRAAYPEATISVLTSPAGATVVPMLPWVDDAIVRRVSWQDASGEAGPPDASQESELFATLRGRAFDAALIFTSFRQSVWPPAYACYLAGIPFRAGQASDFGGRLLTHVVEPLPGNVHQTDRNLWLLSSLGIETGSSALELDVPAVARASAAELLRAAGIRDDEPYIAFAPIASCPARTYDPAASQVLARLLATRSGLPVVLLGHERDLVLLSRMAAPGVVSLAGRTSVPELAAVVERAALLVANDSGPMHIAEAVGTPMAITYSGTDLEEQWRPRRTPSVLLRRPTRCSPCYLFECPYAMECLDIPAPEVATEALRLLGRERAPEPAPV